MKKSTKNATLFISVLVFIAGLTAGLMLLTAPGQAHAEKVVVYKSPTCGCCKAWVKHLRDNGFEVEVHQRYNVEPVKDEMGVPKPLRSCHTAKVGGYVIEGHVPADLIVQLLEEKPAAAGLAVPGMPMGSPGMEGPRKDPYDVILFGDQGSRVYARR